MAVEGRPGFRDASLGLWHNAEGWGPVPLGLSGGDDIQKNGLKDAWGGMGERRKGRLFKKKTLELQSIKLLA